MHYWLVTSKDHHPAIIAGADGKEACKLYQNHYGLLEKDLVVRRLDQIHIVDLYSDPEITLKADVFPSDWKGGDKC